MSDNMDEPLDKVFFEEAVQQERRYSLKESAKMEIEHLEDVLRKKKHILQILEDNPIIEEFAKRMSEV